MMRTVTAVLVVFVLAAGTAINANAGKRIGGGIHYLRTVGDLKDAEGFDKDAIGFMGGMKYSLSLITLEGDVEVIPNYAGSDKTMLQPQAYALLGNTFYGGIGTGIGYLGDFGWQDPFYALRAGVDVGLGPIDVDAFATYRFQKGKDLSTADKDELNSVTFGAMAYFGF